MPKAMLILHRKRHYDDGAVLELKLWQVPAVVPGSVHLFKYSLFHRTGGQRRPSALWRPRGSLCVHVLSSDAVGFPGGRAPTARRQAISEDVKIVVGSRKSLRDFAGTAEDDAAAFLDAVERAERGEAVHERVLSFQSWEGLASVMTGERYRLLRHLHAHPEPSISALARALGRQCRRVHEDVTVLENAGLVARDEAPVRTTRQGALRVTADTIQAEIRL